MAWPFRTQTKGELTPLPPCEFQVSSVMSRSNMPSTRAGALPAAGLAAHLTSLEILFAAKIGLKELPNLADCPKLRMLGHAPGRWTCGD